MQSNRFSRIRLPKKPNPVIVGSRWACLATRDFEIYGYSKQPITVVDRSSLDSRSCKQLMRSLIAMSQELRGIDQYNNAGRQIKPANSYVRHLKNLLQHFAEIFSENNPLCLLVEQSGNTPWVEQYQGLYSIYHSVDFKELQIALNHEHATQHSVEVIFADYPQLFGRVKSVACQLLVLGQDIVGAH